jgi:hypothetical protein
VEALLKTLAPVLLLVGIVLIIGGAALAMAYARVAYQVLYEPENIPVLNYLLGHISANYEAPSVKGVYGGQAFDILLPQALMTYGFTFLMFVGFGLLLNVSHCLLGMGVQIVKALWNGVMVQPYRGERPKK